MWHAVASCLADADMPKVQSMLAELPCEDAMSMYKDIMCLDDACPDALEGRKDQFLQVFVHRSTFMDKLTDACVMSPEERVVQWDSERIAWEETCDTQREMRRSQVHHSLLRLACKRKNARAFVRERWMPRRTETWVVHASNEDLLKQPPVYWSTIPYAKLKGRRLRAVVHRVQAFGQHHHLPPTARHTVDAVFEDLANSVLPKLLEKARTARVDPQPQKGDVLQMLYQERLFARKVGQNRLPIHWKPRTAHRTLAGV